MSVDADLDLSSWKTAMSRFSQSADERIRKMLATAAETVAGDAQRLVPRGPTGAARASMKASGLSVVFGGSRAAYAGWLEFGGRVGINESVSRPFVPGGRYIWPTWMKNRQDILTAMERGMADLAKESGLG